MMSIKRLLEAVLTLGFFGLLVVAITGQYFSYELLPGERALTGIIMCLIAVFLVLGNPPRQKPHE